MKYITHIVFDIDGTLTDGNISIHDNAIESKCFHVKDGLIIRVLPQLGFTTIMITGRSSELVNIRAKDLLVSAVYQGISDKAELLNSYIEENELNFEQFAYIGDDLNDYSAMKMCLFKACPSDASKEIKDICNYISPKNSSNAAVRDICEHLLCSQGKYIDFLKIFGVNVNINQD